MNEEYAQFSVALVKEKNCNIQLSSRNILLSNEDGYPYTLSFVYPYSLENTEKAEEEENDSSAVIWLDYQGVSALFMGDVSSDIEQILIRDDNLGFLKQRGVDLTSTEILKVAHHGSKYSTSESFLQYIHLQTAVISCGADNLYGHPSNQVLDRLQNCQADVYRTDTQENIVITISSDGKYAIKCIPNG